MKFYQIFSWFTRNLSEIILSQRKTIAYLVYGLIVSNKASLIGIAKGMKSETTVRHNLKRIARFMANERINIELSLLKLQQIILNKRKEIFILLDWTYLSDNGYQVLKATVIGDGRGIPFAYKTYKEGYIINNQIKYEKEFLSYLRGIIPQDIKVYIIVDRGFGQKPELLKYIDKLRFYYIARSKEGIMIKSNQYTGKLSNLKTKLGKIYELKKCLWPSLYNKRKIIAEKKKIYSRFIIVQKRGFKSRWIIVTNNYELLKEQVITIYSKRMNIEQTFKDEKNLDRGFCIERTRLSSAQRYDKMFLLISFAYLLLTLFGAFMEKENYHRKLMANTVKYRSISLYQVGRYYYKYFDRSIPKVLKFLDLVILKL